MICRVCDGKDFSLALDLHEQPWGNHFLQQEEVGKEAFYPLRVVYCHTCQTAQLDYTVKKEVMFADHTYLSGITKSLRNHFQKIAINVDTQFFAHKKRKSVLDIGSNDGTQLQCYQELGYDVLGVESAKRIAEIANQKGVPTVRAFFNEHEALKLNRTFDVINASGVFFHLEELHSVTEGIKKVLDEQGIFVVQFLYMKNIIDNVAFDQIYHEHLLFYTLKTLERLLERHGLSMFDAYLTPIHGGSMIAYVTHKGTRQESERLQQLKKQEELGQYNELATYQAFAKNVEVLKEKNLDYLSRKKREGKTIFGMGAPVKGNTLLNYFGIGKNLLDCLVEKNHLRKGCFSPGTHLPIVMEDELLAPPDVYYVLAWNFKEEILKNNRALLDRGVEFYFPIDPSLQEVCV